MSPYVHMPSTDLPSPTSYHQLFSYRARTNPDDPWFYYPEPVTAEKYRILTYKGADALIGHLAAQYSEILPKADATTISKTAPNSIPEPPMVVTTLASNTVQLVVTGMAAQRMQHAFLHMTPLNSDTGIVSLLKAVDAKVLIADTVFYERAEKLAAQVEGVVLVKMIEFDPIDELAKDLKTFAFDAKKDEGNNSSIIFHTSGTSSSAPRPIWHANKGLLFDPPVANRKITMTTGLV
jgi:acyl-CoA synthetase (AMP-forming)/AMP-acid ligase II